MRYFVTGCAGFIGSNLTDRLLARGHEVVGYDNLSTGRESFLESAASNSRFRLIRGDTLDLATLTAAMTGSGSWYFIAPPTPMFALAWRGCGSDLEQNTLATHNVLEAHAQLRRASHRLYFYRIGVRRRLDDPDARRCALPHTNIAIRRFRKACRVKV